MGNPALVRHNERVAKRNAGSSERRLASKTITSKIGNKYYITNQVTGKKEEVGKGTYDLVRRKVGDITGTSGTTSIGGLSLSPAAREKVINLQEQQALNVAVQNELVSKGKARYESPIGFSVTDSGSAVGGNIGNFTLTPKTAGRVQVAVQEEQDRQERFQSYSPTLRTDLIQEGVEAQEQKRAKVNTQIKELQEQPSGYTGGLLTNFQSKGLNFLEQKRLAETIKNPLSLTDAVKFNPQQSAFKESKFAFAQRVLQPVQSSKELLRDVVIPTFKLAGGQLINKDGSAIETKGTRSKWFNDNFLNPKFKYDVQTRTASKAGILPGAVAVFGLSKSGGAAIKTPKFSFVQPEYLRSVVRYDEGGKVKVITQKRLGKQQMIIEGMKLPKPQKKIFFEGARISQQQGVYEINGKGYPKVFTEYNKGIKAISKGKDIVLTSGGKSQSLTSIGGDITPISPKFNIKQYSNVAGYVKKTKTFTISSVKGNSFNLKSTPSSIKVKGYTKIISPNVYDETAFNIFPKTKRSYGYTEEFMRLVPVAKPKPVGITKFFKTAKKVKKDNFIVLKEGKPFSYLADKKVTSSILPSSDVRTITENVLKQSVTKSKPLTKVLLGTKTISTSKSVSPLLFSGVGTTSIIKQSLFNEPKIKTNQISAILERGSQTPLIKLKPIVSFKQSNRQEPIISLRLGQAQSQRTDTKIGLITTGVSKSTSKKGLNITTTPDKIIKPVPFTFDFDKIIQKKKKGKATKFTRLFKYKQSLVASAYNIKGKQPTRLTGLEIRPIKL